ncbi:immunoglobulin superfamily, member 5 [Chelydra serpentina]|nr:immunoglobulin superfamily, member 5 [Chelydra serpentina]
MDNLQKCIPVTFVLFASLTGFGFDYSIVNGPANATVLAGSEARFNCTVSQGWQVIIWLLNGNAVLTTTHSGGAVVTRDRFTQQNYTSGENFISELIIHNVQQNDAGKIECTIQVGDPNHAFLSVQESTYQKELRKVSTKKTNDGSVKTRRSSGNENSGYSPEEPVYTKQMPRIAPLPPMASSFYHPEQELEVSSTSEVPYKMQQNRVSPRRPTDYPVNPRKIRNVTLV